MSQIKANSFNLSSNFIFNNPRPVTQLGKALIKFTVKTTTSKTTRHVIKTNT
jgi:hypothetical protein